MQKLTKREMVMLPTVVLYLIILLAWRKYWTFSNFGSLVGFIRGMLEDNSRGEIVSFIFTVGRANFGPALPLWANMARYFWLLFIYGFGFTLWLKNIVTVRRLG
ncbi:hypothetical protein ACFLX0_03095 [Chloroflexota bacterium]